MTDKEIKTAVKYAKSWLDTGRECYEGYALEKHATQYAKYVVALAQELSALKEKYRWRKQSEEPAPIGQELEIYSPIQERVFSALLKSLAQSWFWRPLDLPEVETK